MPFNLLLPPLLGGFLFISWWRYSHYRARRWEGHRLIFWSAIAGAFLLLIASLAFILWRHVLPATYAWIGDQWFLVSPFPHSGKSMGAFLLGPVLAWLLNRITPRSIGVELAVRHRQDAFEMLLHRAHAGRRMVAFSMKNGKVYVANVLRLPNPSEPFASIGVLPQLSGYRDSKTKRYVFTTDYRPTYEALRQQARRHLEELRRKGMKGTKGKQEVAGESVMLEAILLSVLEYGQEEERKKRAENPLARTDEDFELILPVAEILSAHVFDPDMYRELSV